MPLKKFVFSKKAKTQAASPLNNGERQKYSRRISLDSKLPRATKVYLIDLMHRRPGAPRLLINMLQRNMGKIIINGNINQRISLDEYLNRSILHDIKKRKISKREILHYEKEMTTAGYLNAEEREQVLKEMRAHPKISGPEAHLVIHYFLTIKVLDKIIQNAEKGRMKVRITHKNGL